MRPILQREGLIYSTRASFNSGTGYVLRPAPCRRSIKIVFAENESQSSTRMKLRNWPNGDQSTIFQLSKPIRKRCNTNSDRKVQKYIFNAIENRVLTLSKPLYGRGLNKFIISSSQLLKCSFSASARAVKIILSASSGLLFEDFRTRAVRRAAT